MRNENFIQRSPRVRHTFLVFALLALLVLGEVALIVAVL